MSLNFLSYLSLSLGQVRLSPTNRTLPSHSDDPLAMFFLGPIFIEAALGCFFFFGFKSK